jgi:hypothetical protein
MVLQRFILICHPDEEGNCYSNPSILFWDVSTVPSCVGMTGKYKLSTTLFVNEKNGSGSNYYALHNIVKL